MAHLDVSSLTVALNRHLKVLKLKYFFPPSPTVWSASLMTDFEVYALEHTRSVASTLSIKALVESKYLCLCSLVTFS